MQAFFESLFILAVDMGFYMVIGLLLVTLFNVIIKKEWIAGHLGGGSLWSITKASILGVPLPLCSCGVVPAGLYLKDRGASNAATGSFLISTPQTGVDSIVATYGLMGITFAWFRPLAAFISGIFGGAMIGLFGKGKRNTTELKSKVNTEAIDAADSRAFGQKISASFRYAFGDFIGDIAVHFIVGLIIAALITVFLPADFLVNAGLSSGILAMLVMIVVGAPMYICSTSSIPIALSLIAKGLSPGTAFVFLFMGPFTNIATISILSKKLGGRTTVVYLLSAAVSAIGFGYLLDFLIHSFSLPYVSGVAAHLHAKNLSVFKIVIGMIFAALILFHAGKALFMTIKGARAKAKTKGKSKTTYKVEGMSCENCANAVKNALLNTKNVENADVSLEEGTATVWGDAGRATVVKAIHKKGYTVVED